MREVSGIGEFRAGKIAAGWAEQKAIRDIMLFLHSNGVGTSRAVRIFKTYGHDAIQVMTEDPYRLARDTRGIGFRTADAIAMKLGMTPSPRNGFAPAFLRPSRSDRRRPLRPAGRGSDQAGDDIAGGGSTTIIRTDAGPTNSPVARWCWTRSAIEPCVFLRGLYLAERGIAERLLDFGQGIAVFAGDQYQTRQFRGLRKRRARR